MALPNRETPKAPTVDTKALNLFNEMGYEMLFKHPKAKEFMRLCELMLMKPVLPFGKDIAWGYGNEGRNDFIRNLINGGDKFMNEKTKDDKPKTVKRTRKAQ